MNLRFPIVIVCATLLLGCQSPRSSSNDITQIASSLEKRITATEARYLLLDDIDRAVQTAGAANHEDSRKELEILASHRQRLRSEFESFLSRFHKDDQLWVYRTYVTADRRGGEDGFALVRDGRVVEHLRVMIYD